MTSRDMAQPVISSIITATRDILDLPQGELKYIKDNPERLQRAVKHLQDAIKKFEGSSD